MKNTFKMPMMNISTLIYFVNNTQAKGNSKSRNFDQVIEDSLTMMEFEPSEQSLKNILDFAGSYEVLETESTGQIEMILN